MLSGIDISNNNSTASIAAAGRQSFAMVKATESYGWTDPKHAAYVAAQRAQGRLIGHYAFGYPESDPIAQAKHLIAAAQAKPGDLLALDWEKSSGTMAQRVNGALKALAYLKAATGASPLFYSYPDYLRQMRAAATPAQWAQLTTYPLWIAAYNGIPGTVPASDMFGWKVWTMHQQSDRPYVDRDTFNGDATVWKRLGVPAPHPAPKPPAPPAPKPPAPVTLTVTLPAGTLTHPVTLNLK